MFGNHTFFLQNIYEDEKNLSFLQNGVELIKIADPCFKRSPLLWSALKGS